MVGPGGEAEVDLAEMEPINQLTVTPGVDASRAAETKYSVTPEGEQPATRAQIESDPLWRTGSATQWTLPSRRTRADTAVPQLWRTPDDVYVLLDREAAAIAGLDPGDVSSYSIGSLVVDGEMVGFVEAVPTTTDPRARGVMVVDLDAYNAWANGAATWSFSGSISRADGPEELWVSTNDPSGAIRAVSGQMPDEPEEVWTIGGAEAAFSSRPVQVGLVAILFVGAATGVVLALAGVTGYVLLAVSRRAHEMGILRALGFERVSVGSTFALEQVVVIGLGAAIGVIGGILLVVIMLPFLQLGESGADIVPSILISVPWPQLGAYVLIVGGLLIISVVWATRRVSTKPMAQVLREVER